MDKEMLLNNLNFENEISIEIEWDKNLIDPSLLQSNITKPSVFDILRSNAHKQNEKSKKATPPKKKSESKSNIREMTEEEIMNKKKTDRDFKKLSQKAKDQENMLGVKRLAKEIKDKKQEKESLDQSTKPRSISLNQKVNTQKNDVNDRIVNLSTLTNVQDSKNIFSKDLIGSKHLRTESANKHRNILKESYNPTDSYDQRLMCFNAKYKIFAKDFSLSSNLDFFDNHKENLLELYEFIIKNKGYFNVLIDEKLQDYINSSCLNNFKSKDELKQVIDKYLFHYILYEKEEEKIKRKGKASTSQVDFKSRIMNQDPSYIKEIPVIEYNSQESISSQINKALDYDIVILRNFLPVIELGKTDGYENIFSKEYLTKKSTTIPKDFKIETREQKSNFAGFKITSHTASQMSINEYIDYINKTEQEYNLDKDYNPETIKYAVNIDVPYFGELQSELYKKIPDEMRFCSNQDILKYSKKTIAGITTPQLYLKVKNVWTGGHEENLRLRFVNINHGPSDSLWYGIPHADCKKFYDTVLDNFKFNVYSSEGIWFAPIEFFIKKKINCYYSYQKSGDIILVGPGCLHWVKGQGHSVHSSWNFFNKEYSMIKIAIERYKKNIELKFRNLVPLYSLLYSFIKNEYSTLDYNILDLCNEELSQMIISCNKQKDDFEKDYLKQQKYNHIGIYREDPNSISVECFYCATELFNHYAKCINCSTKKSEKLMCLNCFKDHLNKKPSCNMQNNLFIYYKNTKEEMDELLSKCKAKLYNMPEMNNLNKSSIESIPEEIQIIEEVKTITKAINPKITYNEKIKLLDNSYNKSLLKQESSSLTKFIVYYQTTSTNQNLEKLVKSCYDTILNKELNEEHKSSIDDNELLFYSFSPKKNILQDTNMNININDDFDMIMMSPKYDYNFEQADDVEMTPLNNNFDNDVIMSSFEYHQSDPNQNTPNQDNNINQLFKTSLIKQPNVVNSVEIEPPMINRENDENQRIKAELKKAKNFLSDLINPFRVDQYRMMNNDDMISINKGYSIISKYIKSSKNIEEANIIDFLRKITNNSNLVLELKEKAEKLIREA